jgi:hypothetical protein
VVNVRRARLIDVLVHEDVAVEGDVPLAQEAGVEEVPPAMIVPAGEEEPGRHLLVARLHHSLCIRLQLCTKFTPVSSTRGLSEQEARTTFL